jgi:hypothetical protein
VRQVRAAAADLDRPIRLMVHPQTSIRQCTYSFQGLGPSVLKLAATACTTLADSTGGSRREQQFGDFSHSAVRLEEFSLS